MAGYSLWGCKKSDMTEQLSRAIRINKNFHKSKRGSRAGTGQVCKRELRVRKWAGEQACKAIIHYSWSGKCRLNPSLRLAEFKKPNSLKF